MLRCFVLLLYASNAFGYGYDSGGDQASCGRPYRAGRLYQPPCDLTRFDYCLSAGATYPWHAVRRFVRDNQGLMRRMYGDQRHGHVLRTELDEDVDDPWEPPRPPSRSDYSRQIDNDINEIEPRFLREDVVSNDDVLNTKFVYSEEPSIAIKLAGLKTAPHFRPTTQKTMTTTTTTTTTPIPSSTEDGTTVTESLGTDTTTDTTTDQTTNSIPVINDRIDESLNSSEGNEERPAGAVLFQDMEEENAKKKMQLNYNKMKGVNACPVKEEVVAPFWANNTRGEVLALLNMYPFEQYVHWEKCTHEHRQMYCREGCRCEQQYRLHRLLAYDPKNECRGIFSDWFRFPSCCVCKCYDMPLEFRVTSRSPRFQHDT